MHVIAPKPMNFSRQAFRWLLTLVGMIGLLSSGLFGVKFYPARAAGDMLNAQNDACISDMGGLGVTAMANAYDPAIAYNSAAQQYLVVWTGAESNTSTEPMRIYGQFIDAKTGLEIASNDFLIGQTPGEAHADRDAYAPALAYNSVDDEFLVAWVGAQPGTTFTESEVYAQRLSADGSTVGSAFQISQCGAPGDGLADVGSTFGAPLSLAYNPTDNQYLVVWRCDDVGDSNIVDGEFEITGQIVRGDGTLALADDLQISSTGGDNGQNPQYDAEAPQVAWNSASQQYLVVWGADTPTLGDNYREVFGQRVFSLRRLSWRKLSN